MMLKGHSLDGQTLLCWKDKTFEKDIVNTQLKIEYTRMEHPNNFKGNKISLTLLHTIETIKSVYA